MHNVFQPILHSKRENKPLKFIPKIAVCKPVYANMQLAYTSFQMARLYILAHIILSMPINYWHIQNLSTAIFISVNKFIYANNL